MIIAAYISVRIEQHEHIRMNEIAINMGAVLRYQLEFLIGKIVNGLLISGEKPPVSWIDLKKIVPFLELRYAVTLRVNAERVELYEGGFSVPYPVVAPDTILQQLHGSGHSRANGRAMREEEIGNDNFTANILHRYLFARLVREIEIRNAVPNRIVINFAVAGDGGY